MARLYKKTLIIGATSGIGADLARKLLSTGTSVILTGRRQDRLDAFVSQYTTEYGADKVTATPFDITNLAGIPAFASKIAADNLDLDCVVFNSGVQYAHDFTRPETVNLNRFATELMTNYTSHVHLSMAFLPYLQKKSGPTYMLYMSATLGLVPFLLRTGNYNASKGALHNWIMVFREQLKQREGNNVHVTEIFPPAVQTELHDEKHQPDLKDGGKLGMPLAAFTEELYEGLVGGEEQVGVGGVKDMLEGWEKERQKAFHGMVQMVGEVLQKFLK